MSKQQLTIEHLAPYLPYGLNIMHTEKNMMLIISGAYFEANTDNHFKYKLLNWESTVKSTEAKPLLRPLSDLTKEIEHNGKRFIPIELIGKLFIEKGSFNEGFFGWGLPTGGGDYQDYYLTIEQKEENLWMNTWCGRPDENGYEIESHVLEYTAFFQLIKWHFDVFGLIEKGLAINLNEVK